MPHEWIAPAASSQVPPPLAELHAWPHRSITPEGFAWFFGASAVFIAFPLLALVGSQALWGVLPFVVLAFGAIWAALRLNLRQGQVMEHLVLWPEKITVTRTAPRVPPLSWSANPFWVRARIDEQHKIEAYLTLRGGPREIELGAFLTARERRQLHSEITTHLRRLSQINMETSPPRNPDITSPP